MADKEDSDAQKVILETTMDKAKVDEKDFAAEYSYSALGNPT